MTMREPACELHQHNLLDLKLDGNSTLRHALQSHLYEGQFGPVEAEDALFKSITDKIYASVLADVAKAAGNFAGDACDFAEWLGDQYLTGNQNELSR